MDIRQLLSPAISEESNSSQTKPNKDLPPRTHLQHRSVKHRTASYQTGVALTEGTDETVSRAGVDHRKGPSLRAASKNLQASNYPTSKTQQPTHASTIHTLSGIFVDDTSTEFADTSKVRHVSSIHHQQTSLSAIISHKLQAPSNQSLATVTMEGPSQTPTPRRFSTEALSVEEISTVTALLSHLNENSHLYESHVQLINLLHKGLLTHISHESGDVYTLLPELRQAREAMDSRFAVGEALWVDWLSDEALLASTSEERLAVTELFQKRALLEVPHSARIWVMYINWVESNYAACYGIDNLSQAIISDEDKEICKELFTKDMLKEVLEQATTALRWRIDSSHLSWNRYVDVNSDVNFEELQDMFFSRVKEPHLAFDETKQLFWSKMNAGYGNDAPAAMAHIIDLAKTATAQIELRATLEFSLQAAIESGNQAAIFEEFNRYLRKERSHKLKSAFSKDLRSMLYERALLLFPTNVEWWIEYIDFVISQQPSSHNPSSPILPLIERATRHCPWSGDLWARRILRSDYERRPYNEIEATKHRATNSVLLDVGGMEELLKALVEWCSYLRRHAFSATATEDDKDTAEVGILMALEDMQQAGQSMYGEDFQGDPLFRLEQINIKFLSQARRRNDARAAWRTLVPSKKNSADFWIKYHIWEVTLWLHDRMNDGTRVETTECGPELATAVAEEALCQHALDWPEKIADMYMDHFQHHESVEKVQAATVAVWEFRRKIAAVRAREAETLIEEPMTGEKRKREESVDEVVKKTKLDTPVEEAKRDREHLSITLTNLAPKTTAKDLRAFFKGCGDILSMDIAPSDEDLTSATVEFAQKEDVEFAKTRNDKLLHNLPVHIHSGSQSTLYVTNYPPAYDETAIRKLFSSHGEITSVRFPSLKFNNRRRFCYVQFVSHKEAKSAEAALDGKKLDSLHTLMAKISDPNAKKQRSGAQAEGREVFVKNIDNASSEDEVKTFFEQYGAVESVKLLKSAAGKRLGSGFVVYTTPDEANKAVSEGHGKSLQDRILQISISTAKGGVAPTEHAVKQDIIVKHDTVEPTEDSTAKTTRERQVALFNLPGNVTDARVVAEMEKHGRVVKIQLRREEDAAIVEFEDLKTAFSVRAGFDFPALGPECRSGEVKMLGGKGGLKPKLVSRPAQRTARRGGLGFKRGGSTSQAPKVATSEQKSALKGNAAFRAIFEQGKKAEE